MLSLKVRIRSAVAPLKRPPHSAAIVELLKLFCDQLVSYQQSAKNKKLTADAKNF
jgi:hypothetical protein